MNAERQVDILMRGAVEVVDPALLESKIAQSLKTGVPLTVKLGLDPSAPDIHLGHTVVLEKLRQFQDLGHQVVLLIGDFTGQVGDPTDKNAVRRQLSADVVARFAETYVDQAAKVLDRDRIVLRRNSEWLAPLTFSEIITVMSRLTLARLLERDDFHRRVTEHLPLHLHELMYPLMQGYDSIALHADVELGGTDQRFNIMTARQLQEAWGQPPEVAVFMPLLEGLDGVRKMSKSLGNYVGVTEPPALMFGKVMSIPDPLIVRWGTLLLGWSPERSEGVEGAGWRRLKAELAYAITERYWGTEEADRAAAGFDRTFREGEVPLDAVPVPLPTVPGSSVDLVARLPGIASRGEARRLIQQGGVVVDDVRLTVESTPSVTVGSWVRVGRHRFFRFEEA